jgi:hypothetical protein
VDEKAVADLLKKAEAVVDAAELADDLRPPGFGAAVQLLSGRGIAAAPAPPAPAVAASVPAAGGSPAPATGALDRIAAGMGIDPKKIRNLYEEADGTPVLIVKSTKLPGSKAAGAHDIAILVMAARQLGGIDDYTEAAVLRDAAKRYGKFDQGNFGKHMTALDNLILTRGKGPSAKRKLTQPGLEAAAELAKKYLAEDGG